MAASCVAKRSSTSLRCCCFRRTSTRCLSALMASTRRSRSARTCSCDALSCSKRKRVCRGDETRRGEGAGKPTHPRLEEEKAHKIAWGNEVAYLTARRAHNFKRRETRAAAAHTRTQTHARATKPRGHVHGGRGRGAWMMRAHPALGSLQRVDLGFKLLALLDGYVGAPGVKRHQKRHHTDADQRVHHRHASWGAVLALPGSIADADAHLSLHCHFTTTALMHTSSSSSSSKPQASTSTKTDASERPPDHTSTVVLSIESQRTSPLAHWQSVACTRRRLSARGLCTCGRCAYTPSRPRAPRYRTGTDKHLQQTAARDPRPWGERGGVGQVNGTQPRRRHGMGVTLTRARIRQCVP
jgi:hypothetical protein